MNTPNPDQQQIRRELRRCGPLMDVVRVAANFLQWNFLVFFLLLGLGFLVGIAFGDPGKALLSTFVSFLVSLSILKGMMLLLEETSARKRDLCIFLRAFRSDTAADQLRAWLKAALGPSYKLSGILPPAKRATVWTRLVSPLITGLSYLGSRQFEMEAGDHNWMARLLSTFSKTRFVFMDIRDTTPHVLDEIRLAWSVFGQSRVIFIVDDSKSCEAWKDSIEQLLGDALQLKENPKMLIWPEGSPPEAKAFVKSVEEVMKDVPSGTPEISKEALEFVQTKVSPEDWKTRLYERGGVTILISLVFTVCLKLLFPIVGLIYGMLLGLMVQGLYWAAWRRARKQRKFAATIRAEGPPSGLRLWLSALAVGGPTVLLITALVASFVIPIYANTRRLAEQVKAVSNARQITMLCQMYAADNNGQYPDSVPSPVTGRLPSSSNEAFRTLFQEDLIQDERIFGCGDSPFVPDGNIGTPPLRDEAVSKGENHWAMTRGLTNQDGPAVALIYENPAIPSWPPFWDADMKGRAEAGRAWANDTIIVSSTDGSVQTMKLDGNSGPVSVKTAQGTPSPFIEDGRTFQVLNIEP
ncbi:hypothetical protein [Prosthecobacter dejongeii]|uniref:Uncharacterized protein n=1 Tax=Prosthecobacter dejongeii TaxID=48465 RepID=A0A7W8DPQ9_9BACT|nr:hypothetical protein [Prosthecobacter dejongeii]MBB5037577.1 hypothetical protein [Prosthecobacter dejongeii]